MGWGALAFGGLLPPWQLLGGLFPTARPPNEEQMWPAGVF